jgi:hypothetical protein
MSRRDRRFGRGARHVAAWSLAVCCLLPLIVGFTAAGIALDAHLPEITVVQALLGLPLMGVAIALLLFAGAALWLMFARFWVPRDVAAGFFLVGGVGWLSAISRWLFEGAYGR